MRTIETISLIEVERLRLESEHNPTLTDLQREAIQRSIEANADRMLRWMLRRIDRNGPPAIEEVIAKCF
jgi:hypothetical protein